MQLGITRGLELCGDERWYLVHTLPKKEQQAELQLRAQGFRPYLPLMWRTIRHARQLRTVRRPLFPRYLFVILNPKRDPWLSVRSTIGVSYLISSDSGPIPVPVGVVESLIKHSKNNLSLLGGDLAKGQTVRIMLGPFAEFVGTLDKLDDNGRVRVLLDMMGTAVPVALHRSALAPAA